MGPFGRNVRNVRNGTNGNVSPLVARPAYVLVVDGLVGGREFPEHFGKSRGR